MTDPIRRIQQAHVENVRGIIAHHDFDLDAPLVLLTGPNGMGKTSLLDALSLALNGKDGKLPVEVLSVNARDGSVSLSSIGGPAKAGASIQQTRKNAQPTIKGPHWTRDDEEVEPPNPIAPDFSARASTFFQDRIALDLDAFTEILVSERPELAQVRTAIEQAKSRLEDAHQSYDPPDLEDQEVIEEARKAAAAAVNEAWTRLPTGAPSPEGAVNLLRNGNLPKRWRDELRDFVQRGHKAGWVDVEPSREESPLNLLKLLHAGLARQRSTRIASGERPGLASREIPSVPQGLVDEDTTLRLQPPRPKLAEPPSLYPFALALDDESQRLLDRANQRRLDEAQKLRRQADAWNSHLDRFEAVHDLPGLGAVLDAIATRAPEWLEPVEQQLGAPGPLPEPLVKWIDDARDGVNSSNSMLQDPLPDIFHHWVETARSRIQTLRSTADLLLRQHRIQQALDRVAAALREGELPPALVEDLRTRDQIPARDLDARLRASRPPEPAPPQLDADPLKDVGNAIDRWIVVEERQQRRDEALAASAAGQAAKAELEPALTAIAHILGKQKSGADGLLRQSTGVNEAELGHIRMAYKRVVEEFRVAPHVSDLEIHQKPATGRNARRVRWEIGFRGGPGHESLSTGQKGQVGIGLLLAINILASRLLNHRVILLDDFTSTLDLNQLPRVAMILRRLAYSGEEQDRRQVIISSHHEDMTNRLVDLLMPPPGETLRLLQFHAWDVQKGPDVTTRQADGVSWDKAERRLDSFRRLLDDAVRHLEGDSARGLRR